MLIHNMETKPFAMPVTQLFFNSLMYWLLVILMAPAITMRLFAQEKASGTFETLMTTSVGDLQVVAAKFVAALIFYMMAWLPTLLGLVIIQHFTNQPKLDMGVLGGMYLGVFLSGGLFLSIGCLASSLTKSQMVSADSKPGDGGHLVCRGIHGSIGRRFLVCQVAMCYLYFNLFKQMEDFTRGVVDTRTIIFYASATFLFLFLTLARGGKPPVEMT